MENENLYTFENPEYRKTYWHTCSHIMAQAVKRLWPEVQLAIGPAIDEGWLHQWIFRADVQYFHVCGWYAVQYATDEICG